MVVGPKWHLSLRNTVDESDFYFLMKMAGKLSYLLLCILNPFRDFCSACLFVDVEALGSVELVSAAIIFMIIYGLQQSKLSTWEQTDSESERLH